jgi:hypothetical protein
MAASVHRPLKVVAFNANDIWRQRYELSKQLQGLYIDVASQISLEVAYSKLSLSSDWHSP